MPLFPLNAVMFPGVVTPLHIFEERYRALVRELLTVEAAFDRVFGIVAIREGFEVGDHGMQSVHRVGTLVQLTEAEAVRRRPLRHRDHRSAAPPGARVGHDRPVPAGEVELLDDVDEPDAAVEAERALSTFEVYRDQLSDLRADPCWRATCPPTRRTSPTRWPAPACSRSPSARRCSRPTAPRSALGTLRRTLHEEMRAMRALPSLPATEVARTRWSPN